MVKAQNSNCNSYFCFWCLQYLSVGFSSKIYHFGKKSCLIEIFCYVTGFTFGFCLSLGATGCCSYYLDSKFEDSLKNHLRKLQYYLDLSIIYIIILLFLCPFWASCSKIRIACINSTSIFEYCNVLFIDEQVQLSNAITLFFGNIVLVVPLHICPFRHFEFVIYDEFYCANFRAIHQC